MATVADTVMAATGVRHVAVTRAVAVATACVTAAVTDVTLSQAATFTLMAHLQTADVTLSQAYMAHRRIRMITSQVR